ncbi:MAG: DNA integrity scanning protein DisA [Firmicutes bacterium ADurb.Bin182]|nr:MAG: DNA integrity scanning protein DisA [Firmicutes bacterium ADurb.Bin182]
MSFDVIVKAVTSGFSNFSFWDFVDIAIIAILLYQLISLTKETRAYQVLKGIGMLFLASAASQLLGLTTLRWLLDSVIASGIVVVVILFQPELRRALEQLGRGRIFEGNLLNPITPESGWIVSEMSRAILNMSKKRIGALIVMEQRTGLGDIIATGTRIEGLISSALLENIFEPNTPLHDGAVIIRDGRIVSAGCFLPLADDVVLSRDLGTRHRAALGISTVSDSVTVVISEETGVISFTRDGKLVRYVDSKALRDLLESIFLKEKENLAWLKRRNRNGKAK